MVKVVCQSGEYAYILSQSTVISEDFDSVQMYGISIIGKDSKSAVEDISDDFDSVYSLFDLIVNGELCPEHLENVVEDFLSDNLHIIPFRVQQHTA